MKRNLFVIAGLVGSTVVGMAPPASAQVPRSEADQVKSRQKISMMESVLESAVANGADSLMRAVRAVMPPDALMLTGAPSARGFRLEGYGIFFDVEVPAFRRSMAWTLRQMVDESGLGAAAAVNQLKAYIATVQDPRQRANLDRALRRLELQVGPVGPVGPVQQDASARTVGASTVAAATTIAPAAPAVDPAVVDDPNGAYTREVSVSIVDAMIENSGPLPIGDNEWLTVAARDNVRPDRLVPGDTSNISSIVFRVKGADLAAYRAGKMTLEEARAHVEVNQF
ncbi:MAG TPA: hypothetical protein VN654_19675 [Vicinamibacterales bacterium]|jgi:hypothetical protein|nr:hypothetical protein [Vicinamibacterales bacterium]